MFLKNENRMIIIYQLGCRITDRSIFMSCFHCQINHRANDIITHGILKRLPIKNTTHERN